MISSSRFSSRLTTAKPKATRRRRGDALATMSVFEFPLTLNSGLERFVIHSQLERTRSVIYNNSSRLPQTVNMFPRRVHKRENSSLKKRMKEARKISENDCFRQGDFSTSRKRLKQARLHQHYFSFKQFLNVCLPVS